MREARAQASAVVPSASTVNRKASARALFEQGLELLEAQHWAAAADKFERARQLHASPRITYNLTTALLQLGRLVYASELLRELTTQAAVERSVQEAAETRLKELRERLGRLTVMVDGEAQGLRVELDGRALDPALLDVPMPADPGEHTVVARREGVVLLQKTVHVHEGQEERVHLAVPARPVLLPPPPAATEEAVTLSSPEAPAASPGSSSRLWLWVAIGAGLAAGVVATTLAWPEGGGEFVDGTAGTATLRGP